MAWDVEFTDEFGDWWDGLASDEQDAVRVRVDLLAQSGPSLKRPTVGAIKGSRHDPQMKELVVEVGGASIRILFVFDPRRTAILLIGGDKAGEWNAWYDRKIPEADTLYETYLQELRDEGKL